MPHLWKIADMAKCIQQLPPSPFTGEVINLGQELMVAEVEGKYLRFVGYESLTLSSGFVPVTPAKFEPRIKVRHNA